MFGPQKISEAAMAFVDQNSRDVVARIDLSGRITHISQAVRRFGYAPEDLIGRDGMELAHPDDRERLMANTAAMLRGEPTPDRREHRFRAADGAWIWIEGNPYAVRDADGEVVEYLNVFRDVTWRRGLEERAREQADLFEAAFQHASTGMALVDLGGGFLRANRAFCQIVGLPEAVLKELDFQSLTHPDDLALDLEHLADLRDRRIDSYRIDKRYLRPDGAVVWVRLSVSMARRADGSAKHYVAQAEDLTDRRRAEHQLAESEARYRLIAENTSDMIIMSDLSGVTTYATPSVRRLGWAAQDLVGQSFTDRVHPEDSRAMFAAFGQLLRGEPASRVRWRARRQTGGWVWLESNPCLLFDPLTREPSGFVDAIRDVSEQVAQEELLAEARREAEAAAAAKSQFLANMSHEIRTPLTAVLGFAGLLKEVSGLPEAARRYVGKIVGAGNGLLAVVNDILDFSRLEAGRFEVRPQPTDAVGACRETLEMFSNQAEAKGLSLTFEAEPGCPRVVMLDGERLRQMLINLIGNAVKFTESGGVTVRVGAGPGETLEVAVRDTGPGLDAAAQAALFQRFTQVDGSRTRSHGGAGLGLAICRGVAEAMGGSVGVESAPGAGATFRLSLPAPAADLPAELAEQGPPPAVAGARVFVVDDNAANRELARRVLEAAGAEVREADGGLAALAELARLPQDVVLMDLRMPGLDGRGTLARLRAAAGPNQDIPVLAFTADADVAGAGDLAAFDGLVRKPIEPLEMYRAIAQAFQWSPESGMADVA